MRLDVSYKGDITLYISEVGEACRSSDTASRAWDVIVKDPVVLLGSDTITMLFKTHPAPADRLLNLDTAMGGRLVKYDSGRSGTLFILK
jgi:hypothetical protein